MTEIGDHLEQAVERFIAKMRAFAGQLEPDERACLAALIGPGVAMAHRAPGDEVEAFEMSWEPSRLPDHLAQAVRDHGIEIIGL